MDDRALVLSLEALANPTRLRILRHLAQLPQGLPAGMIADRLQVKPSTLSNHLFRLERVGLVLGHRSGRAIVYHVQKRSLRHVFDSARRSILPKAP